MKILVSGSRDIADYEAVRQAFIRSGFWKAYKQSIEVVCGMALSWKWHTDPVAGGVDRWAYEFAMRNNLKVHDFHADWKKHGKAAGFIRNVDMGQFTKQHDGRILAVWDGKSPGTKQMIEWARDNRLEGFVYRTDKLARYAPVGAKLKTDFSGKWTEHTLVHKEPGRCQSGIFFSVYPPVPKAYSQFVDADWFQLIE